MARTPLKPEAQQSLFDESLKPDGGTRVFHSPQDFAAAAPVKKKAYKRRDFSSLATRYLNEAENLVVQAKQSEDPASVWRSIDVPQLVGLYALFHREVYEVLPGELAGDWAGAVSAATKLVKDELEGSMVHAVEYMQWVFVQQKKRLRRSSDDSTWRVGWRWLFLKRELMTDYRRSLVQGEKKRRA